MANCEKHFISIEGKELLSFDFDNDTDYGLEQHLTTLSQEKINEITEELKKTDSFDESVKIDDYSDIDLSGEYRSFDVSTLSKNSTSEHEEIINNIIDKTSYISAEFGKPLRIIVVKTNSLQYSDSTVEGFAISNMDKTIFVQHSNNISDFLMNLNHEINHVIYDNAIKKNYNDIQRGILDIYNAIKNSKYSNPITPREKKINKILDKLLKYPKEDKVIELFNWIYGDTDVYNFVKASLKNEVDIKLFNNLESHYDINPKGRKLTIIDSFKKRLSAFEGKLSDHDYERAIKNIESFTSYDLHHYDMNLEDDVLNYINKVYGDNEVRDSKKDDLPFSIGDNVLDRHYDLIVENHLQFDKNEDFKNKNKKWYDALEKLKSDYEKNGTMNLEYEEAKPVTSSSQIYKLQAGSIIQVPFYMSKPLSTWMSIFPEEVLLNLIPNFENLKNGVYKNGTVRKKGADDLWVDISFPKLYNYISTLNIDEQSSEVKSIFDKVTDTKGSIGKKKTMAHQRVMNKMVAYVKLEDGVPAVAAPKLLKSKDGKEYKTIAYYPIEDVVATRKFIGKAKTSPKIPRGFLKPLEVYKKELSTKTTYDNSNGDFDWEPEEREYVNPVLFKGSSKGKSYEFTSVVTKDGNLRVTGNFGQLNKIAKTLDDTSFIKFTLGYNKDTKKHDMVYGRILGNGASGVVVVYKNGRSSVKKVISHSAITEIFFPANANSEVMSILEQHHQIKDITSDQFKEFIGDLYSEDTENTLVSNIGWVEKQIIEDNPDKTEAELVQIKSFMMRKAKPSTIVKYIERLKNGKVESRVGTLFTSDNEYSYVIPRYGNEIIKIPHANRAGSYDKTTGAIVGHFFNQTEASNGNKYYNNPYAIDTVFIDQTSENEYVKYLEELKDHLKSTSYLSKKEPGYTTKTLEQVKEMYPDLTTNQAYKRMKEINSKTSTSYNDFVDVIQFHNFKTELVGNKKVLKNSSQMLSEHEQNKILAKLRLGDMLLYFNEYNDKNENGEVTGDKLIFERWQIITGFDEDSGLPIISYRTPSGRIKSSLVKPNHIKSVGLQLQRRALGNAIIEGRQEVLDKRIEQKKKFLESKDASFTKSEASEIIESKNERFKKDSNLKYSMVAMPYVKDSNGNYYFSYLNIKGEKLPPGVEQRYKIVKSFRDKDGNWNNSYIAERKFMLNMNELSNASNYNFDAYVKGVRNGSILRISKIFPTGRKYYDFYVEGVTANEIRGQVLYNSDNPELDYEFFPMSISKTDIAPTFIHSAYNVNYNKFEDSDMTLSNKDSISSVINRRPTISKSESDIFGVKKSKDALKEIRSAVDKITELYGADVSLLDTESMKELGAELELDLTKARGLVHDNKIYINGDIASAAEAFHELGHIIIPGLKALNPKAWELIKIKISGHPVYEKIANYYGDKLSDDNLAEEVFVTIFGEYFREKFMDVNSKNWFDDTPEFESIVGKTNTVLKDIFDLDGIQEVNTSELMNMSLLQIMNQFGERMISGGMKLYFDEGIAVNNNTFVQSIYSRLIDSGDLIQNC